jgi:N-methylhydantoinase B
MLEGGGEPADRRIAATVRVAGTEITVDFAGTDPQVAGNLNCPLSVTKSAVYFVLRVVTDPDIPASAGAYRPVRVTAPPGCLVNAQAPAAVAGGNVETSSRIADVVMLAFGGAIAVPAQGQGTMNNLTLGNESFTYYETIGGGQGACPNAVGPAAVHVAMSNTLNTPVEALEQEFPLRVTEYSLRRGSGGQGRFAGGDGIVREFEALAEMDFALLTERRRVAPRGAAGGAPGRVGRNTLEPGGAERRELPGKAQGRLAKGDRLRIESPGGGGYGPPESRRSS